MLGCYVPFSFMLCSGLAGNINSKLTKYGIYYLYTIEKRRYIQLLLLKLNTEIYICVYTKDIFLDDIDQHFCNDILFCKHVNRWFDLQHKKKLRSLIIQGSLILTEKLYTKPGKAILFKAKVRREYDF